MSDPNGSGHSTKQGLLDMERRRNEQHRERRNNTADGVLEVGARFGSKSAPRGIQRCYDG
jgi:hypothetical protein